MPVYLKEVYDLSGLEGFSSILIVPCRFCPAASLALSKEAPYFQFLTKFLKTDSYEKYLETIKADLCKKGIKADIFKSRLPNQFVICMWTSRRRNKLAEYARSYEAVVVMGCETAAQTIFDSIKHTSCKVFKGMRTEGIMSIKPMFHLPLNISLELNNITPLVYEDGAPQPWINL